MKYASICSGIEAATAAWHPLGWRPVFFAEVEAFPNAVLVHHYPDVPNLGDVTKFHEWPDATFDVLVGGTPCQSFSVAGLRGGMADPRGNLALVFLAIADRFRPEWVVWENVPGVLSSNGGKDFGAFLGGLGELGYGWAYRVLDAQYCGVPQRRRRVFVVGHLGDWRRAAAVLFERASLSGDPAPSRETGKGAAASVIKGAAIGRKPEAGPQYGEHLADGSCYTLNCTEQHAVVAPTLSARTKGGGGLGSDFDCDGGLIGSYLGNAEGGALDVPFMTSSSQCRTVNNQTPLIGVTHSLRADGFDASEDGTGRGTPLVPVVAPTLRAGGNRTGGDRSPGTDVDTADSLIPVMTLAIRGRGAFSAEAGDISSTLRTGGNDHADVYNVVAFHENQRAEVTTSDTAGALKSGGGKPGQGYPALSHGMQVRRLTPRECERLQGFPDDYTLIPFRGKPAADGPRYKALGNSMAVPCMRWIGQRIQKVMEAQR